MVLKKVGVLLAGDGLHPSSSGIRISYPDPDGKPKIMDGPFTDAKELIAGYTLIEVKSREEAIEWAVRMPDPHGFGQGEINAFANRRFKPGSCNIHGIWSGHWYSNCRRIQR